MHDFDAVHRVRHLFLVNLHRFHAVSDLMSQHLRLIHGFVAPLIVTGFLVVIWEISSRVTKVPFAESRRLLIVMESPSVIRKVKKKRNSRKK